MIHDLEPQLAREIDESSLAYTCERCAYFEPDGGSCSSGYPNDDHREETRSPRSLVVFCKEFELA